MVVTESTDHFYNTFSKRFWLGQIDLRPLGFMRIVFGLVTFNSILDLSFVLFDFFSDAGVAPRSLLLGQLRRNNSVCLYDLAGPPWVLITLYILTLISILIYTVGWHSRWASVATFLLVCGIHERNLQVFDGSDNILRVILFWMMFMPTGARYSVDAVLRSARGLPTITHASALPIRLGQVQIAWVYLNTIVYKWPGVEWRNGTALRIALGLDHLFTRWLGHLIYNQEWLTILGTHYTVIAEISILPLIFLPWSREQAAKVLGIRKRPAPWWTPGQPSLKGLALLLGTGLHFGIAVMMSVGHFSYIMISTYFLLYEPEWIEFVVRRLNLDRIWGPGKTKVLYDGDDEPSARTALVLRGFDVYRRLELVNIRDRGALAGNVGALSKAALAERLHVVGDSNGKVSAGFAAWTRIARRLPALIVPGLLGALVSPIVGPAVDRGVVRRQLRQRRRGPTAPGRRPGSCHRQHRRWRSQHPRLALAADPRVGAPRRHRGALRHPRGTNVLLHVVLAPQGREDPALDPLRQAGHPAGLDAPDAGCHSPDHRGARAVAAVEHVLAQAARFGHVSDGARPALRWHRGRRVARRPGRRGGAAAAAG